MKRYVILILTLGLLGSFVSAAAAASIFKQTGVNPFYRPPLTSEEDLRALVNKEKPLLQEGFAKAGYPLLFNAFTQQFPSVKIDAVKIQPGETFKWMLFRKKGTGPVIVSRNITWQGSGPLDAYRFYLDRKGKRYEIVVLSGCGNFALRKIDKAPAKGLPAAAKEGAGAQKAKTPAAGAVPAAPGKPVVAGAAVKPGAAEQVSPAAGAAGSQPDAAVLGRKETPPPAASAAERAAVPTAAAPGTGAQEGAAAAGAALSGTGTGILAKGAAEPEAGSGQKGAAAGAAGMVSTAKFSGGPVVDAGFSYQFDPASYLFARVGYEFPLVDKLSLMVFVGGSFRVHGEDGESAFIADALLDYRWWNRLSFGLGAGYWSGNDGQLDLIANLGFLVYGKPDAFNSTLFIEGRSAADELGSLRDQARLGLGIRFRF